MHCPHCRIHIRGVHKHCPLCQSDLREGDGELTPPTLPCDGEVYPVILPARQRHKALIRLAALGTIAVGTICLGVNFLTPENGWWSLFVLAGLASLWVTFGVVVRGQGHVPKNIFWQVSLVSILALLWDWRTGFQGWSIDYVLPNLFIGALIAMYVTSKIMRLHIEDYILYLMLDTVIGFVPLVLLLTGTLNVRFPSVICVIISIISLSALILLYGKELYAELRRRFHI